MRNFTLCHPNFAMSNENDIFGNFSRHLRLRWAVMDLDGKWLAIKIMHLI